MTKDGSIDSWASNFQFFQFLVFDEITFKLEYGNTVYIWIP